MKARIKSRTEPWRKQDGAGSGTGISQVDVRSRYRETTGKIRNGRIQAEGARRIPVIKMDVDGIFRFGTASQAITTRTASARTSQTAYAVGDALQDIPLCERWQRKKAPAGHYTNGIEKKPFQFFSL